MIRTAPVPIEEFMGTAHAPPAHTEEALAMRFAEDHSDRLRFVASWSKWLHWSGSRWETDETLLVFDLVRGLCRAAARECNDQRTAATLASAKTVAAVERLARSDRRLKEQGGHTPALLPSAGRYAHE